MTQDEIKDLIDDALRVIRTHKEEMAKTAGANADMAPRIEIHRGGHPVALLVLLPAREAVASGIYAAVTFFRADAIVLTYDSWGSDAHENPDTGAPWSATEMGEYVEKHGRGKAVHEALHVHVISSAGSEGVASLKYTSRVSTLGTTEILWVKAEIFIASKDSHDDGFYQEVAAYAFDQRQATDHLLDPVRKKYAHHSSEWVDGFIDASVCTMLEDHPDQVLGILLISSKDQPDRSLAIEKTLHCKMSNSPEDALEFEVKSRTAQWN